MSKEKNKKRKVRNKSRDMFTDYYKTGLEYDKENRARQEAEGGQKPKGLKNLNSFEMACVVIIALAIVGFFIKIVVLGHSFTDIGF